MKQNIILLFLTVVLLSSCSSTISVNKREDKTKKGKEFQYSDFQSAIEGLEPDYALKFAYDDDSKAFAKGFSFYLNGSYDSADVILKPLYLSAKNDFIKANSENILFLISKNKFDFVNQIKYSSGADSSEKYLFTNILSKFPFSIDFTKKGDTLELNSSMYSNYIVVEINSKKYKFSVDFSSTVSCIYDSLGYNLDIIKDLTKNSDKKDSLEKKMVRGICKKMKIGESELNNIPIFRDEIPRNRYGYNKYIVRHGRLGWDILSKFDLTINLSDNSLILRQPTIKYSPSRNLFNIITPIVKLTNENGINNYFSFGYQEKAFMYNSILPKIQKQKIDIKPYLLTDGIKNYWGRFPEISEYTLSDKDYSISLNDILVYTRERFYLNYKIDGVFGNDIFENAVLHFDATNGIFEILSD